MESRESIKRLVWPQYLAEPQHIEGYFKKCQRSNRLFKRFRCRACEDRAAKRSLDVCEQRESKRNAADEPFVKPFGFYRQGILLFIIAPPLREYAPGQQPAILNLLYPAGLFPVCAAALLRCLDGCPGSLQPRPFPRCAIWFPSGFLEFGCAPYLPMSS